MPLSEGESYSESVTDKFLKLSIPCPFLSSSNSCLIYDVRPYMCRRYLVFTEPEKCEKYNNDIISYRAGYFDNLTEIIDVLSVITFKNARYTKHISSWFLKKKIY